MARIILFLLTVLIWGYILSSCSASKHLQIAKRKDPSLFDTLVRVDSVPVIRTSVKKDTIYSYSETKDTIIFHKDRLTVKYFPLKEVDSVYISGECEADTVYKVTEKRREITTIKEKELGFWDKVLMYSGYTLAGLSFILLAVVIIKR